MSENENSVLTALNASTIIIIMTASGALSTRVKVSCTQALDNEGCESISKMTLNMLLPSLIFTETIKNIDVLEIRDFGLILFFCTCKLYPVNIIIGCFTGLIFASIQGINQDLKKVVVTCIGFQDSLIIPLIFVNVIEHDEDLKKKSIGFILTYTLFNSIYLWTVGYV